MDAQDFIDVATHPETWFEKAAQLRRAGDVVWQASLTEQDELAWMGYLTTTSMLYAMALEAAMKGRLLLSRPEDIRLVVESDGTGTVRSASLQRMTGMNHDLVALADSLDLIGTDADVRKLLQDLTNCLVWIGRYPVPRAVSEAMPMRHHVPIWFQNVPAGA